MRFAIIFVSSIILSGCNISNDGAERVYIKLSGHKNSVEVLSEPPQREYELIADVQWEGGTVKKMQKRAQYLGGDAVIIKLLGGQVDRTPQILSADSAMGGKTFNRMVGTVIKYK